MARDAWSYAAPISCISGLISIGLMFFALTMAAGYVGTGGGGSTGGGGTTTSCGTKMTGKNYPSGNYKDFIAVYQAAAAKYKLGELGPSRLAGVHFIETGHRGSEHGADSSVGALGPMQFMPPTWAAYGVDANGDGKKDVHDPEDAIFGAANYLHASGAPGDWHSAILAYNHAEWYYQEVWDKAEEYKSKVPACSGSSSSGSGGGQNDSDDRSKDSKENK